MNTSRHTQMTEHEGENWRTMDNKVPALLHWPSPTHPQTTTRHLTNPDQISNTQCLKQGPANCSAHQSFQLFPAAKSWCYEYDPWAIEKKGICRN